MVSVLKFQSTSEFLTQTPLVNFSSYWQLLQLLGILYLSLKNANMATGSITRTCKHTQYNRCAMPLFSAIGFWFGLLQLGHFLHRGIPKYYQATKTIGSDMAQLVPKLPEQISQKIGISLIFSNLVMCQIFLLTKCFFFLFLAR